MHTCPRCHSKNEASAPACANCAAPLGAPLERSVPWTVDALALYHAGSVVVAWGLWFALFLPLATDLDRTVAPALFGLVLGGLCLPVAVAVAAYRLRERSAGAWVALLVLWSCGVYGLLRLLLAGGGARAAQHAVFLSGWGALIAARATRDHCLPRTDAPALPRRNRSLAIFAGLALLAVNSLDLRERGTDALVVLGRHFTTHNDALASEHVYRRATAWNPDSAVAHGCLAAVLHRQAKYALAVTEAAEAARLEPGSYLAHYVLGMSLRHQNHFPEAEVELLRARDLTQQRAPVLYELAQCADAQGHLPEAIAFAGQAVLAEPASAAYRSYFERLQKR